MEKIQEIYMFIAFIIIFLCIIGVWYNNWRKQDMPILLNIDHKLTDIKKRKVYFVTETLKGNRLVSSDICALLRALPQDKKVLWAYNAKIQNSLEYEILNDFIHFHMKSDNNIITDTAFSLLFDLCEEYEETNF